MTEPETKGRVGRWSATALVFLGIVGGLITILDWVNRPEQDLVADVWYGEFRLPPAEMDTTDWSSMIADSAAAAGRRGAGPRFARGIDSAFLTHEITREIRALMFSHEQKRKEGERRLLRLRGYWSLRIANEGQRQVEDVRLVLPNLRIACIEREGIRSVCGDSASALRLGNMQAKEVIGVFAWADDVSQYRVRDIRLSHADGLGEVWTPYTTSRFWSRVEAFFASPIGRSLVGLAISLVLLLVGSVALWLLLRRAIPIVKRAIWKDETPEP